ncbi:hypothetical protein BRADI_2g11075v3 [Brachypodium distachyon]|uniref:Uncharacterized protein n=1 Tax=Brachypodium distachyon TaxID=15368 RepID=A0A0Q3FX06_BRADI|nr:hypothetical protein BRADI_2g11075v3 [Brachypodium distachyon]
MPCMLHILKCRTPVAGGRQRRPDENGRPHWHDPTPPRPPQPFDSRCSSIFMFTLIERKKRPHVAGHLD